MMMLSSRTLTLSMVLMLASGAALGAQIDWALVSKTCDTGESALEVPCGEYGTFHLLDPDLPSGCEVIEAGSEVPPIYTQPANYFGGFIGIVEEFEDGPIPVNPRSSMFKRPSETLQRNDASRDRPWIATIDFDSVHGLSTAWLSDLVAGQGIDTYLLKLDKEGREPLGDDVSDFHVLASLCEIVEAVDNGRVDAPLAVGMSFGRAVSAREEPAPDLCDTAAVSCQISGVIRHMKEKGIAFAGAAGNHRELLYPAYLEDVVSVGMLELNSFVRTDVVERAWETPRRSKAWMPGNGLCLDGWAAPAGASYSNAIYVGWLAALLRADSTLDPTAPGRWTPRWNPAEQCYVLAHNRELTGVCNQAVTEIIEGLMGGYAQDCWTLENPTPGASSDTGTAAAPPDHPSLDTWLAETHPTPESDPCVPCVGAVQANPTSGSDLVVDFSQSPGLDPGVFIDSISLRVGTQYYPVQLSAEQLAEIEEGSLTQLTVIGGGTWATVGARLSFTYQMKNDPAATCTLLGSPCFWTSDPILIAH